MGGAGIIYIATCLKTGKSYIGKTSVTFNRRINQHYNSAAKGKLRGKFYNALRKYSSRDDWKWEILINNVDDKDLNLYETCCILTFDTKLNGYNSTFGGDGGSEVSAYRISEPWNKGKKIGQRSNEIRKLISSSLRKTFSDPVVRKKISDNHADISGNKNPMSYESIMRRNKCSLEEAKKIRKKERV